MSTPNTVKAQIQELIDTSNRVTGKSDTDLTGAVDTLVDAMYSLLEGEFKEFYSPAKIIGHGALTYKDFMESVFLPNATKIGYKALCENMVLKNVYIPQVTYIENYALYKNPVLEYIDVPKIDTSGTRIFESCGELKNANLHNVKFINNNIFNKCVKLEVLILTRTSSITTLNSTDAFINTPIASGTGYIYVPRAQIENYKTATNWVTFASQFRALEDYTVDGTIEGELDWDKVNGGAA